jgi:undecaprenyl-diphosphatase
VRLRTLLDTADVAAYALAHRGDAPKVDRALQGVTRAADFSALWLASSAVLALTQGRAGRRAAVRGLLSVGVTSAVVNGPLKSAVRRPRPANKLLPADRLRHRGTRTTSFPSGHTASAAAFAVGAATELPRAAVPLGLAATLVGASRVRTGAHYPGDVLGGAVVGAAVALATRKVWPVQPKGPAAVSAPDASYARPTGKGVTLVVNPDSGLLGGDPASELQERLPDLQVVEAKDGDLATAVEAAAQGTDVLAVAGGDGSVNAAAAVALERDIPLAVVPAGTLNHFAHDIGLESLDDVVVALQGGHVVEVDVGLIAEQVFLNTASLGWYAYLVGTRERLEDRIGKWPAVLVALAHVLRKRRPVEVELDGVRQSVWMVFFGCSRYRPRGFAPSWRERLDDGVIDVRVVRADVPGARLRLLLAALSGTLGRTRVHEERTAKQVAVRSLDGPLKLARDGEVFDGPTELVVTKSDRRLRVYGGLTRG